MSLKIIPFNSFNFLWSERKFKFGLFFFFLFYYSTLSAQNLVYIPDENFRKFLKKEYPGCMKGKGKAFLKTNAKKVLKTTKLDLDKKKIENLTGIQCFVNLKHFYCGKNSLIQLPDLSALSELVILYIDSNLLTSLPDLSKCVRLKKIDCSYNKLKSLDPIQKCKELDDVNAEHNHLTDANVFQNSQKLMFINLQYNALLAVPDLRNQTQLAILDLSFNNISSFNAVNIFTNDKIGSVYLDHNKIQMLSPLDSFPSMERLCLANNLMTKFPSVKTNTAIENLDLRYNQIKEIPTLPCSFSFDVSNSKIEKITQLKGNYVNISKNPIKTMTSKIEVRDLYMDSISLSQWPDLRTSQLTLFSASYSNINSVSLLPQSLETIKVDHCKFKGAIDIGAFEKLQNLDISFNQITSIINLDAPYKLKKVNCHGNRFEKVPSKTKNKYLTRMYEEDVWVECDCCL